MRIYKKTKVELMVLFSKKIVLLASFFIENYVLPKIKEIHSKAYFSILILLAISVPLSRYFMSIAQILLIVNWLVEGDLNYKFKRFFKNKAALVFSSLWLMHIIGLFFTDDFNYAFKDLRTKLPILILPIILSSSKQLNKKQFNILIAFFIAAVLSGSFISGFLYFKQEFIDIRENFPFISHIRFSLNVCLAIFSLAYFLFMSSGEKVIYKVFSGILIIWLIAFLIITQLMTGVIITLVCIIIILIYYIFQRENKLLRLVFIIVIIIVPVCIGLYVRNVVKEVYHINPIDLETLDKTTDLGNPYAHDLYNKQVENGYYVWIYISRDEMREAWNKRSSIEFFGRDKKNQLIETTMIRFLTSKGYRKDAEGVNKLNDHEICLIENGMANSIFDNVSEIRKRVYIIIWEIKRYNMGSNSSGHSVMQRLEYWKASLSIIKNNFWLGVGTGDMNKVFNNYYEKENSLLDHIFRWRSHNQFLSIFVGFGIIGFIWFIVFLLYPPLKTGRMFDYYYFVFFIISMLSMLSEDTIESQAGVTFFAYFSCLFLFAKEKKAFF